MSATKPKNFRMSQKAVKLLRETATRNNITETDVIEHCVARYAIELGIDVERAKALLLEHVAKMVSARKSDE
ncbi:MAG: hypothetical protein KGL39_54480 [Patescibacteria group bacterium]|nr:hypothetical protein [Patescibacteria group bacterium]